MAYSFFNTKRDVFVDRIDSDKKYYLIVWQ